MSTSRRHTNWARAFSYYRRWTVLAKLHWLPVKYRVHFKLAVITFNAVTTQQPSYLAKLLNGLTTSVTSCSTLEHFKRLLETELYNRAFDNN